MAPIFFVRFFVGGCPTKNGPSPTEGSNYFFLLVTEELSHMFGANKSPGQVSGIPYMRPTRLGRAPNSSDQGAGGGGKEPRPERAGGER